jgi:ATP-dependent DNA ligase
MEFRSASALPDGHWQFEPKWDGFRCIVARDGDKIDLTSKSGQNLGRYFPELIACCRSLRARRYVIDGEIVMRSTRRTFDDLLQRIHPAASRVATLSQRTPASLFVFDMLVDDRGKDVTSLPLTQRRTRLETFARRYFSGVTGLKLSPVTRNRVLATRRLAKPKPSMDGVIAKDLDAAYLSGSRDGGCKVKRVRTADCVVGGFRYAAKGRVVGSLLLGLYDSNGKLNHVGFTSSFDAEERRKLVSKLRPLIAEPGFTGKKPGGPSRWSTRRTEEWEPLKPRLVAEIAFDRVTNDRIRHGARFVRWRPDKKPKLCGMDQLGP